MKVIIYGTGQVWKELGWDMPNETEIIAYADSHEEKCTSKNGGVLYDGKPVYYPNEITTIDFDYVYICTNSESAYEIKNTLISLGIDKNKIRFLFHRYVAGEWSYEYDSENNIIHNVNGIRIRERAGNKSDYQTIGELFVTNCYGVDICHEKTVVIDMGMNIGLASLIFAKNANVSKVYSFEPFKDTYEAALFNFSINGDIGKKIYPQNCAISDFEGNKEISVLTEFAGGRSTESAYTENVEGNYRKENIKYRNAKSVIEEIFNENSNSHFLLKIDTEGSEFPIFESIKNTDLLKKVDVIVMEYHRQPNDLLDCLRNNDFLCISPGNKNIGLIYAIKKHAAC